MTLDEESKKIFQAINNFLFTPFKKGFIGFTAILTVLLITETLSFITGFHTSLIIDIIDLQIAASGFIIQILICFLRLYSSKKDDLFIH